MNCATTSRNVRPVPVCSNGEVTPPPVAMSSTRGAEFGDLTRVVRCSLDEDQCLSLHNILTSFQTAINEEQAWALCYQTVKCFSQHHEASQCYLITDPSNLSIHKDGFVHPKSLFPKAIKSGTGQGTYHDS